MTEQTKAPEVLTIKALKEIIATMADETCVGVCINQLPVILPIGGIAPGQNENKQPYMLFIIGEKSINEALAAMEVLAAQAASEDVVN